MLNTGHFYESLGLFGKNYVAAVAAHIFLQLATQDDKNKTLPVASRVSSIDNLLSCAFLMADFRHLIGLRA